MKRRSIVLVGTSLVAVLAGVIWYLEPVLGGLRMDLMGIPRAGVVMPSPVFLLLKLTLALLGAFLMARLLGRFRVAGLAAGARFGAVIGLIGAIFSFDSAQAGQPLVLILTDGAFMVLVASFTTALLAQALASQPGNAE